MGCLRRERWIRIVQMTPSLIARFHCSCGESTAVGATETPCRSCGSAINIARRDDATRVLHCTVCGARGHNRRTCPTVTGRPVDETRQRNRRGKGPTS